MHEQTSHLTLEELAERVAIPVRTIRYYITEGLLPRPEGRGKATTYSEEQLQRLRLIRLLSQRHMPLAEMAQLLNRLSLAEVQALLAEEEQQSKELEPTNRQPAPQEYIATLLKNARAVKHGSQQVSTYAPPPAPPRSLPPPPVAKIHEPAGVYDAPRIASGDRWQRWELAPGVELHVKESVEEQQHGLIERLCQAAGIAFYRSHP